MIFERIGKRNCSNLREILSSSMKNGNVEEKIIVWKVLSGKCREMGRQFFKRNDGSVGSLEP